MSEQSLNRVADALKAMTIQLSRIAYALEQPSARPNPIGCQPCGARLNPKGVVNCVVCGSRLRVYNEEE